MATLTVENIVFIDFDFWVEPSDALALAVSGILSDGFKALTSPTGWTFERLRVQCRLGTPTMDIRIEELRQYGQDVMSPAEVDALLALMQAHFADVEASGVQSYGKITIEVLS